MRGAYLPAVLLSLLRLCLPGQALTEDQTEPETRTRAFVEVIAPRAVFVVQERIPLRLRIGYDPDFFRTRSLPLFRQDLDLSVQVLAPWLEALPGTLRLDPVPGSDFAPPTHKRIALNDSLAWARQTEDETWEGRRYSVLEIEHIFLAEREGVLKIPAPRIRFVYATKFQDGLLGGRIAADRREALLSGNPLWLRIDPLPEQGRPVGFAGAVGRFTVRASATPLRLRVGESLRLDLTLEGQGNLINLQAPSLGPLEGFHLFGWIEQHPDESRPPSATSRTFLYDLVPLHERVRELPRIPFSFFDPTAGYRTIHTEPIPLKVEALPEGASLRFLPGEEGRQAVPGKNDIYGLMPLPAADAGATEPSLEFFALVLLGPWLLAGALLAWLRMRERARSDPEGRRARGAATAFQAQLAGPEEQLAVALAEYLSARLKIQPAAVIGPGLAARLQAAGVEAGTAARAEALLEALGAARYGGKGPAEGLEAARELVAELEQGFLAREAGS